MKKQYILVPEISGAVLSDKSYLKMALLLTLLMSMTRLSALSMSGTLTRLKLLKTANAILPYQMFQELTTKRIPKLL